MLDDFREWLSDNLRYLLLGLVVILLIVIAFFTVKLVTGKGKENKNAPEAVTEKISEEEESETEVKITLEKNKSEILDVMTKYYTARAEKDVETLRAIEPDFSAEDEADLQNNNPIERYDNITVYSREGLTDGAYIVYVYFDAKVVGIDTLAPTLTDKYLETDEEGNLIIVDKFCTQELTDFVEMMRTTDAVQALIKDVNQRLSDAAAGDSDLQAYIVAQKGGSSSQNDEAGDDSGNSGNAPEVNSSVKATTDINVRSEASTNGVLYGTLSTGMKATILENLDSGWSKISYTVNGTTIEGYVMTQYLESAE
ncbi:MAG: SH3 domain-containing protein [Lachnospiraceae bacterium]|nr:SH3 domain-containing protein [Lachnospiraceae bacterium]